MGEQLQRAQLSIWPRLSARSRARVCVKERDKDSGEGSGSDGHGSAFKIQDEYSLTVPPETPTNLDEMAFLLKQNLPDLVTTLVQNLPGLVNSCRESSLGSCARYTQDPVNRTRFTRKHPRPAT